jgi:hypothetical protein
MIESRCGIVCGECKYREKMNCGGCVYIEKPFWGDFCPVKNCCEGKGFSHCGNCSDFPCDLLNQFAYDKEQGDNGKRIEQCRKWAASNENEAMAGSIDKRYVCYCGRYCENCAVKAKVEPAAKALFDEMKKAGFEEVISFIPGGDGFWSFLKGMVEEGMCSSCKDGSGDPGCSIRICAKDKSVNMCALCAEYPCGKIVAFFERNPALEHDNVLLRDKGWQAWVALQDKRKSDGYIFQDDKQIEL